MPKPNRLHSQEQQKKKSLEIIPYVCNSGLRKKLYITKYSTHCDKCLSKDPFHKYMHINLDMSLLGQKQNIL